MKTFVLDASVTMSWCFEDELSAYAESVLAYLRRSDAVVPPIWPMEVANTLLIGERRGRVVQATTEALLEGLRRLSIQVDSASPLETWTGAIALGRAQRLSVYDATYLALALRHSLPLATRDSRLRQAAHDVSVPVLSTGVEEPHDNHRAE
ncbi:MAG: type II toxin-antitoxin system VapC family toxin [Thermomicrobiales bacterium]